VASGATRTPPPPTDPAALLSTPLGRSGLAAQSTLRRAGIRLDWYTVRDLLFHLPRRYDDLREMRKLGDLRFIEEGTVVSARGKARTRAMLSAAGRPDKVAPASRVEAWPLRCRYCRTSAAACRGETTGSDPPCTASSGIGNARECAVARAASPIAATSCSGPPCMTAMAESGDLAAPQANPECTATAETSPG